MSEERTSFTQEVIQDVQKSWSTINADLTTLGNAVLYRYFMKHPSDQEMFPGFAEVEIEVLQDNPNFLRHALAVARTIDKVIQTLGDYNSLIELLKKYGEMHRKKGVTPLQFENMREVVFDTLVYKFGKEYVNSKYLNAWRVVLDDIFSHLQNCVAKNITSRGNANTSKNEY